MAKKRKNGPEQQPELPIDGAAPAAKTGMGTPANGNGNGSGNGHTEPQEANPAKPGAASRETHVQAENVALTAPSHPFKPSKIELPLHRRVDRGFLDYASYVIRDRAI